jgi:hypothetical protein
MPDLRCAVLFLLVSFAVNHAQAADPEASTETAEGSVPAGPTMPVAPEAAGTARHTVPAGTELLFEMGQTVTSKTAKRGDRFPLRLAEPLRIDGHLLVPAGTPAMGEVVHADHGRAGGQAGELVLAARYLEWDGRQLPLKAFSAGVGKNRTNSALGVSLAVGLAGYLVRGGNIEMAAGSLITSKLRDAAELPAVLELETPATPDHTQSTTGEHQE